VTASELIATVINPLGRKRIFLGRLDDDTFREAFNHYAQSGVADLLRTGMVSVYRDLVLPTRRDYPETRIALEVHDALMHYPTELRDSFTRTGLSLMEIPFNIRDHQNIIIPVDAAYGPNWGDLEKWNNATT